MPKGKKKSIMSQSFLPGKCQESLLVPWTMSRPSEHDRSHTCYKHATFRLNKSSFPSSTYLSALNFFRRWNQSLLGRYKSKWVGDSNGPRSRNDWHAFTDRRDVREALDALYFSAIVIGAPFCIWLFSFGQQYQNICWAWTTSTHHESRSYHEKAVNDQFDCRATVYTVVSRMVYALS